MLIARRNERLNAAIRYILQAHIYIGMVKSFSFSLSHPTAASPVTETDGDIRENQILRCALKFCCIDTNLHVRMSYNRVRGRSKNK